MDPKTLATKNITPLKRVGEVEDVVKLLDFLQNPNKSGFITGCHYKVDGGITLAYLDAKL